MAPTTIFDLAAELRIQIYDLVIEDELETVPRDFVLTGRSGWSPLQFPMMQVPQLRQDSLSYVLGALPVRIPFQFDRSLPPNIPDIFTKVHLMQSCCGPHVEIYSQRRTEWQENLRQIWRFPNLTQVKIWVYFLDRDEPQSSIYWGDVERMVANNPHKPINVQLYTSSRSHVREPYWDMIASVNEVVHKPPKIGQVTGLDEQLRALQQLKLE